jgi:hypothetical protein
MSAASVQIRLDVTAIQNGVVRFGSEDQGAYCAVIEVVFLLYDVFVYDFAEICRHRRQVRSRTAG